jgi:hypothetical protein
VTPKSSDFWPAPAAEKPSAARPRFTNSRTADARLGMRREKRQSSSAFNYSPVSMI